MGDFKFGDCKLKHYVRVNGWLPHCKARKREINKGVKPALHRRLRYLTLCAVDAIDVLMLDVAKVLQPSRQTHQFDSVAFFNYDERDVDETRKNISGAHGYIGDFVNIVLEADRLTKDLGIDARLGVPADVEETFEVRDKERRLNQYKNFKMDFPFDVINLDLEEAIFKPTDEFPGKVINALRVLFDWQKHTNRELLVNGRKIGVAVDSFTLMFTARLPTPESINVEYGNMLRESLSSNLERDPQLAELLRARGVLFDDLDDLERRNFKEFYLIALRKYLSKCLLEADWYVDDGYGVETYEFERVVERGTYTMFHLIFEAKRQTPPWERRASNAPTVKASDAYNRVVDAMFRGNVKVITEELAAEADLTPSLDDIAARRRQRRGDRFS